MRAVLFSLILSAALVSPQRAQRFTGKITDSMCPAGDHSKMKMGATDGECTIACVDAHGASYILYDGKNSYNLSDQVTPQKFAGKKVAITGTLDTKTKTIQVKSIAEAK
jgi:hypothetical protein